MVAAEADCDYVVQAWALRVGPYGDAGDSRLTDSAYPAVAVEHGD